MTLSPECRSKSEKKMEDKLTVATEKLPLPVKDITVTTHAQAYRAHYTTRHAVRGQR